MKINKKELVSIIQSTETFIKPKIELEQYCIDAKSAVDIIFLAGIEFNDIEHNIIFDLGTGTGRLSIACAFMKAHIVISTDIDWDAMIVLKRNIQSLDLEQIIFPICSDMNSFEIKRDLLPYNMKITTIMNPPFGVQKRTADRIFLKKAFTFSDVVYSIHLASEKIHSFITKFINQFNWIIDYVFPMNMVLEKTFQFHTQKKKKIDVNIYRLIKKEI
ncbi:MAG: METTL5 family protein [Candidatus Hodarchaeota archaeon]